MYGIPGFISFVKPVLVPPPFNVFSDYAQYILVGLGAAKFFDNIANDSKMNSSTSHYNLRMLLTFELTGARCLAPVQRLVIRNLAQMYSNVDFRPIAGGRLSYRSFNYFGDIVKISLCKPHDDRLFLIRRIRIESLQLRKIRDDKTFKIVIVLFAPMLRKNVLLIHQFRFELPPQILWTYS